MSLLQDKFDRAEGWTEDGIYFRDGRVILLSPTKTGIFIGKPTTIEHLIDGFEDESWSYLNEYVRQETEDFVVTGGGTSWEADGWVALQNKVNRKLIWFLILSGCEPVKSLVFVGDTVEAESKEYPFSWHWQIPIWKPERLRLVAPH